jgi:hypothetical protein
MINRNHAYKKYTVPQKGEGESKTRAAVRPLHGNLHGHDSSLRDTGRSSSTSQRIERAE